MDTEETLEFDIDEAPSSKNNPLDTLFSSAESVKPKRRGRPKGSVNKQSSTKAKTKQDTFEQKSTDYAEGLCGILLLVSSFIISEEKQFLLPNHDELLSMLLPLERIRGRHFGYPDGENSGDVSDIITFITMTTFYAIRVRNEIKELNAQKKSYAAIHRYSKTYDGTAGTIDTNQNDEQSSATNDSETARQNGTIKPGNLDELLAQDAIGRKDKGL